MRISSDAYTSNDLKLSYINYNEYWEYLHKLMRKGDKQMLEALDRYDKAIKSKQVGDMPEVNLIIFKYENQYGSLDEIEPEIINQMCAEIEAV